MRRWQNLVDVARYRRGVLRATGTRAGTGMGRRPHRASARNRSSQNLTMFESALSIIAASGHVRTANRPIFSLYMSNRADRIAVPAGTHLTIGRSFTAAAGPFDRRSRGTPAPSQPLIAGCGGEQGLVALLVFK